MWPDFGTKKIHFGLFAFQKGGQGETDILRPQAKINKKWFLLLIFTIPLVGLHTVDIKIECPSVLFEWKPVAYGGLLFFFSLM